MNKSPREAEAYLRDYIGRASTLPSGKEIIFFIPAVDLWLATQTLNDPRFFYGAQNCHYERQGAFTGETSPAVLAEIGVTQCLVGHSERRALFHESDSDTARKVASLQASGLTPMLCVGESLAEREANRTGEVIVRQLRAGLSERLLSAPVKIAYEPVWAIGTGRVATPEQAGQAHDILRRALTDIGGQEFAATTPILYGGSVKPDNAAAIAGEREVDGFLVGGASLEVESFVKLCQVKLGNDGHAIPVVILPDPI